MPETGECKQAGQGYQRVLAKVTALPPFPICKWSEHSGRNFGSHEASRGFSCIWWDLKRKKQFYLSSSRNFHIHPHFIISTTWLVQLMLCFRQVYCFELQEHLPPALIMNFLTLCFFYSLSAKTLGSPTPRKPVLSVSARKIKDNAADWHNLILKWEALNDRGFAIANNIANMKISLL